MVPQVTPPHPGPVTFQFTIVLGRPEEETVAKSGWAAPSSTEGAAGDTATVTSLLMMTVAFAD